ncbi:MAG: hypothetical protein LBL24_01345 [Bacteroidales bacterium]|jgi:hypothetical protein|nr:hypothetical protein [Bacteroidales bacterium]
MSNNFKDKFQAILNEYHKAITKPLEHKKYYLGVSPDHNEAIPEYTIIQYSGDFSLLKDMYSELLFYGEFFLEDGVEMFKVNRGSEGKKVNEIKL